MEYNKGFAPIIITLIIAGFLVLGGSAYYLNKSSSNKNEVKLEDKNTLPTDQNIPISQEIKIPAKNIETIPQKETSFKNDQTQQTQQDITSSGIEINFLSVDKINIINSKLTLDLYGYDMFLADASATLITRKEYSATSIPFSIILPYPNDPIKLIEKNNGDRVVKDNYYITIDWDNNGDGTPNNNSGPTYGDISIDWNNQKSEDSEIKLIDGEKYTVYLKQID